MNEPPRSSSASPPPIAADMIRLNFTKNSVYNTLISSEENDIMYEVSTPNVFSINNRVTTLSKFDKSSGQKVFAGEIAWKALRSRTEVRIGWQDCEWTKAQEWLNNPSGISTAKTFTDAQGLQYRWKLRKLKFHLTVPHSSQEGRDSSLAIFHCPFLKGLSPAYLEVSSGVLQSLDHILVALIILEKIRRE